MAAACEGSRGWVGPLGHPAKEEMQTPSRAELGQAKLESFHWARNWMEAGRSVGLCCSLID
jgi:hypothetical protein